MSSTKKITFLILLGFLLTKGIAQDLAGTPAAKRVKEVIELLNGTSSYKLEDYVNNQYAPGFRDAFPLEAHKGIFQTTQTMFGKVNLVAIIKTIPNEISIVLKSETKDAWLNLSLLVESDAPHRIVSIVFRPEQPPNTSRNEKKAQFSNLEELHQYLLKKSNVNEFSGVLMIAKNGTPIFKEAYGYASKENDISNKIDTKFNLGSINKTFTTVAIAQLMEKGELSIDDPIGKYLDMFPRNIAEKVTIRHLLNMRSGWGDYWSNEYYIANKDKLMSVSDYMDFIEDLPLDFEPGTNFQHSNTGYEVAGAIIEKISSMDYFDYIKKNIYEAAGMTNSDSYFRDNPIENRASGYSGMTPSGQVNKAYKADNLDILPPRGTPAGGGYSTIEDILKFDKALRSGKLLNTEYTQYVINRLKGSPDDQHLFPKTTYRAAGRAPGVITFLGMDFQSSYSIIVLSNYDNNVAMEIAEEILNMLGLD